MVREVHFDYFLLSVVILLTIFGILILTSVSAPISQEKFGTGFYYLRHQILFGLLPGLIIGYLAFKIKLDFLKKWALALFLINILFLGMVFLPGLGINFRGASRWVNLGFFSFQPSEFLKPIFILYLASWLAKWTERNQKNKFGEVLPAFLLIIVLVSLFLIFQPDISTLLIILSAPLAIYFLAKTPFWHTLLILLLLIIGSLILIQIAPYRLNRISAFLNPELDPMGLGYQVKQALISIGSGGIAGLGLGLSEQRFGFLPQSISDSIFAILAEETGFIGSFILILLYLIFFWRGFKIGERSRDQFSRSVAFGITFWITLQAFVNIGAMIRILPLTGIPLPFISYGGSALVSELIGVGILLNISRRPS
jgi:cell division protein FtsW